MGVKPPQYHDIEGSVSTIKDLIYPSSYKDNLLDIHFSKDVKDKIPVIFWIHGGAYVGGNKKDVTEYAIQIASHGFAVVNINYELAISTYPGPIIQLTEAYQYITEIAADYPIDLDQLFFAGDSAGAQIASQFVNIQVDFLYAKLLKQIPIVPAHSIQGALLFCGPYDHEYQFMMHRPEALETFEKVIAFLQTRNR